MLDDINKNILLESRLLLLAGTMSEKEIAKSLFVSETHLRNLYNRYLGAPPKRYIKKVKLKKGETLLRITGLNVSEISYRLGYINASKFSEDFKRAFNFTPTQYRENIVVLG